MRGNGWLWPHEAAKGLDEDAGRPPTTRAARRGEPTRAEALGGSVKIAAILDALGGAHRTDGAPVPSAFGHEISVFLAGGRQAIVGPYRQSDERRRFREQVAYAIEEVLGGRLTIVAAARDMGLHTNSVARFKNCYILGGRVALERELGPLA